jgi:hypothetical protein
MYKYSILVLINLFLTLWAYSDVDLKSSDLPIIIINTNEQEISDSSKIVAHMGIIYNPYSKRNYIDDRYNHYNGFISMNIRGTTSATFPKKQYRIETIQADSSNYNVSLLGMPKENDWILHAPYSDKSLIRNVITYSLANDMGYYAPRTRFCELILNGQYQGIYVLMEVIKRDRNRVDIAEIEPNINEGLELTGGYLLKIDRPEEGSFHWYTNQAKLPVECVYPKTEDINNEQKEYIKNYIQSFEDALYSPLANDTINGFHQYIDMQSCADFFIINELAKNVDAYRLSTFFHKNRDDIDPRLKMGPVWDFNIAYGNVDYNDGFLSEGFIAENAPWWDQMLSDSVFNNVLQDRWVHFRKNELLKKSIDMRIDSIVAIVNEASERNFDKWDVIGEDLWPNYFVGDSYSAEIEYLSEWFDKRISWIDSSLLGENSERLPIEEVRYRYYPIPLGNTLKFEVKLDRSCLVNLAMYDYTGKPIATLIDNIPYEAGNYNNEWDLTWLNFAGSRICIVVLHVDGEFISTEKLICH